MQEVVIIGAGGHAREVLDIFDALNEIEPTYDVRGWIVESNYGTPGSVVNDKPILGDFDWFKGREQEVLAICGVGAPEIRRRLTRRGRDMGVRFGTVVHPGAALTRWVTLGEGVVIAGGCILTNQIRVGNHVHINRACTVGHDVIVEDFATLAPGANVSGNVVLGAGCYIGTGTIIVERKRIGSWATVGAGSVIIDDVQANTTVVGVPARAVKTRSSGWHLT